MYLAKEPQGIESVQREHLIAKNDCATMEFNINEEIEGKWNEEHQAWRLNYSGADFDNMKFFKKRDGMCSIRPQGSKKVAQVS